MNNLDATLANASRRKSIGRLLPLALLLPALALTLPACRIANSEEPAVNRPAPKPISSIRVGEFKCDNAVTGEAVRNVFIEMLTRYSDVKVVRDGDAEVVLEGTVTQARGYAGGGSVAGKNDMVGGDYVSGVTSIALRDGQVLTSASWGQSLAKGRELLPPETVARHAADRLLSQLGGEGLKRR